MRIIYATQPTPCSTRNATNIGRLGATAQAMLAAVTTTSASSVTMAA